MPETRSRLWKEGLQKLRITQTIFCSRFSLWTLPSLTQGKYLVTCTLTKMVIKPKIKYSQNSLEKVGKAINFTCHEVMLPSTMIILHLYAVKAEQEYIGKII